MVIVIILMVLTPVCCYVGTFEPLEDEREYAFWAFVVLLAIVVLVVCIVRG